MKERHFADLKSGLKTVGVVADSDIKRRQIVDALHLLKIPGIRSYQNFFEMATDVDKRAVQWIYCTLNDPEKESLLSYLPQMSSHPGESLCTVVLLKQAEKVHIPELFNSGLLHWLDAEERPDAIADAFHRYMKQIDQGGELALHAFYALRSFLKTDKRWAEIAMAAERLLKEYPRDDMLKLNFIEALAKQGEQGRARSLLLDLDLFDSKLAPYVAQLQKALLHQNETHHRLLAVQYDMRSALIVDPLPESAGLIEAKCRELGFRDLKVCADGAEAATYVKKEAVDFVVLEWQCPTLSGPFLIQRIREERPGDIPILVVSDNLDRSDVQLVKDMGVAQVLKRPLDAQQLTIAAAWAISQAKAPTEALSIERKLLASLAQGKVGDAEQLLKKFQRIGSRDPHKDLYLKAAIAYQRGSYSQAKKLLLEATHRSNGDNVNVAALLAKCLIKLGDSKAALQLLKKITSFSPKNLERLCSLASVALQNNDVRLAEESLYAAEALDPDGKQVHETKVKVAVAGGLAQVAGDTIKLLADIDGVIAYLNNLAVSLAKSHDFSEAVRLYKNCLKVIPPARHELRGVVAYNLGLALVKNKEGQLASIYLKQAVEAGASPVYQRALSLQQRIIEARRQGSDLTLRTANPLPPVEEQTLESVPFASVSEDGESRSFLLKGMVTMPPGLKRAS